MTETTYYGTLADTAINVAPNAAPEEPKKPDHSSKIIGLIICMGTIGLISATLVWALSDDCNDKLCHINNSFSTDKNCPTEDLCTAESLTDKNSPCAIFCDTAHFFFNHSSQAVLDACACLNTEPLPQHQPTPG